MLGIARATTGVEVLTSNGTARNFNKIMVLAMMVHQLEQRLAVRILEAVLEEILKAAVLMALGTVPIPPLEFLLRLISVAEKQHGSTSLQLTRTRPLKYLQLSPNLER